MDQLNEMVRAGVLRQYALGGAMAAIFYAEPAATYDLDVFVLLPEKKAFGTLTKLSDLYDHLKARGHSIVREHVMIEGIPVRFLPAFSPLIEEAVDQALTKRVGKTSTRVVRPEHLLAIMASVGRAKDRARAVLFMQEAEISRAFLSEILERHGLQEAWRRLGPEEL